MKVRIIKEEVLKRFPGKLNSYTTFVVSEEIAGFNTLMYERTEAKSIKGHII